MPAGDIRAILAAAEAAAAELLDPPTYPRVFNLDPEERCDCQLRWEAADRMEIRIAGACEHHGQGTVYFATLTASLQAP